MAINKLIAFALLLVQLAAALPQSRMINGIPLDKYPRFPHHVTIFRKAVYSGADSNGTDYCSGNIINSQWILTSMRCAQYSSQFEISFQRMYLNDGGDSKNPLTFSVTVDGSAAVLYPTEYPDQDDIALIKLPIILDFLNPAYPIGVIQLASSDNYLSANKLGVMAGFGEDRSQLQYGMFRRENSCSADRSLQFCVIGWNAGAQVPCNGNEGGGLLVNWPQYPTLVGIFSKSNSCTPGEVSVFTHVYKYVQWIQFVVGSENLPVNP